MILGKPINGLAIALEAPVCIDEHLQPYTDFDWIIGSEVAKNPAYAALWKDESRPRRYRVLDSGAFEGEALSIGAFMEMAMELEVDEICIPDVLASKEKTITLFAQTISHPLMREFKGLRMGVVQGETVEEWLECYYYFGCHDLCDVIGLTYHKNPCNVGSTLLHHLKPVREREAVRLGLIHKLVASLHLNSAKPHHILGLCDCRALAFYKLYHWIRSIDTSFSVQLGMQNIRLQPDSPKPKELMDFNWNESLAAHPDVLYNMRKFQLMC